MHLSLGYNNWQNSHLSKKHIISLFFALAILSLLLMLPIQIKQFYNNHEKSITVDLIKIQAKGFKQTNKEMAEASQIIKPIAEEKSKSKPNQQIIKKPQQVLTPKIIHTQPILKVEKKFETEKKQITSAVILNSLQQKPWLNKISKEFQALDEKDMDFKFKQIVKAKTKNKLVIDSNEIMQIQVKETYTLASTTAHILAYYLYIGIGTEEAKEKTRDDMPFCNVYLGRSYICPSNNPLSD